jgi:hypothetical protein
VHPYDPPKIFLWSPYLATKDNGARNTPVKAVYACDDPEIFSPLKASTSGEKASGIALMATSPGTSRGLTSKMLKGWIQKIISTSI